MKLLLTLVFASILSFNVYASVNIAELANAKASTADWVTEASIMLVKGPAAGDLYQSLDVDFTLGALSSSWDQYRTKENSFAKCSVNFYREDSPDGEPKWVMQDNAECAIKAPRGTVQNQ